MQTDVSTAAAALAEAKHRWHAGERRPLMNFGTSRAQGWTLLQLWEDP